MLDASIDDRNPLLSVVIPVFNLEEYIEECVESIVRQLPEDQLEIICVDDGSTDRSLELLYADAAKHSNLFVLSQENQGVSAARNIGLSRASGRYVTFVDGDDWLSDEFGEVMLPLLRGAKYDCIMFAMEEVAPHGRVVIGQPPLGSPVGNANAMIDMMYRANSPYNGFACAKVVKRSILFQGNVLRFRFEEGRSILEDEWFWLSVAPDCRYNLFLDKPLYCYRKRSDSATSIFTIDKVLEELDMRERIMRVLMSEHVNLVPEAEKRLALCIERAILFFYAAKEKAGLKAIRSFWQRYPGALLREHRDCPARQKAMSLVYDGIMVAQLPWSGFAPFSAFLRRRLKAEVCEGGAGK